MENQFSRTELLIGEEGILKLGMAKVALFGTGGVGGYVAEALARCGVGRIDLIDNDKFSVSNINRQLHATYNTLGQYKVDVVKERIKTINPDAVVNVFKLFYSPDTSDEFDFTPYDYIVDAVDTVSAKIDLIVKSKKFNIPIISSMGAGNKMHPEMFEIADISKTSVCPLAKVIRQELKKRKISKVKVVYSKEIPLKPKQTDGENIQTARKQIPGSIAFVPAAAGLIIAGEVVRDLLAEN